jgi:microcystin-dependent protein
MQVTAKTGNQLTLQNPPVNAGAGAACPVGSIQMFGGSVAPSGWLICDGSAQSRTTFVGLYQVIGTTYGVGDGSTTFNLPPMQGAFPLGANSTTYALGATGGEAVHALTIAELAAHSHTINISDPGHAHSVYDPGHNHGDPGHNHGDPGHNHGFNDPSHLHVIAPRYTATNQAVPATAPLQYNIGVNNINSAAAGTGCYNSASGCGLYAAACGLAAAATGISIYSAGTGISASSTSVGSGNAHNNMPPYVVVNYIIKY